MVSADDLQNSPQHYLLRALRRWIQSAFARAAGYCGTLFFGAKHSFDEKDGGAGRNRTDDRGFAVLGLTTWRPRHLENGFWEEEAGHA